MTGRARGARVRPERGALEPEVVLAPVRNRPARGFVAGERPLRARDGIGGGPSRARVGLDAVARKRRFVGLVRTGCGVPGKHAESAGTGFPDRSRRSGRPRRPGAVGLSRKPARPFLRQARWRRAVGRRPRAGRSSPHSATGVGRERRCGRQTRPLRRDGAHVGAETKGPAARALGLVSQNAGWIRDWSASRRG